MVDSASPAMASCCGINPLGFWTKWKTPYCANPTQAAWANKQKTSGIRSFRCLERQRNANDARPTCLWRHNLELAVMRLDDFTSHRQTETQSDIASGEDR